jgi:IclR family KDG regulon transcriptional repressor
MIAVQQTPPDLPVPIDERAPGDSDGRTPTSVQRALQILDCFRTDGPVLGVSQIARLAGLPKSTAFRLLNSLSASGYVNREGAEYRLAWHVFELGSRAAQLDVGLREAILPWLVELQMKTGFTVHMGVLQGRDVLYVEKIPGRSGPKTPTYVGARVEVTCTALGKSLLAHASEDARAGVLRSPLPRRTRFSIAEPGRLQRQLQKVRSECLAFDREESTIGLGCISAPLLHDGRAWAAISISGPPSLSANRHAGAMVAGTALKLSELYRPQASRPAPAAV